MPFKKGKSGNAAGRPKGQPNKLTKSAKEAFQLAFEGLGGAAALKEWAKTNKTEFFKLYAKLIPTDITSGGEPLIPFEETRRSLELKFNRLSEVEAERSN
jgi:hypothetical protein